MQGIEHDYCNVCVRAVIMAWQALFNSPAVGLYNYTPYGKGDTLGLDAIPEIAIKTKLNEYDSHSILVTEELDEVARQRLPNDSDPVKQPLMFFSDPTDRSKVLKEFIEEVSKGKPTEKIGKILKGINCAETWEKKFEPPAIITGATSAITGVRKSEVIFSVILNYITKTIFVATPKGIFYLDLPNFDNELVESIDLNYIFKNGKQLNFLPAAEMCKSDDDAKRLVTFLGKEMYKYNFDDSKIFLEDSEQFLHHTNPGGPSRILYLSEIQKPYGPIGFILANGEKIGEWIHWLAFAKFAKTVGTSGDENALDVFEITVARPMYRDGVLMTPSPAYSIFREKDRKFYLDVSRLKHFQRPSTFRAMLVVTQRDNFTIECIMHQHLHREISLK